MADPGASPLIGGRGPVGSGLATGIDPCHQLAMGTVAFCPLNPSPVTSSGHLGSISGAWVLSTPYSTKKSRLMPELAPVIEAPRFWLLHTSPQLPILPETHLSLKVLTGWGLSVPNTAPSLLLGTGDPSAPCRGNGTGTSARRTGATDPAGAPSLTLFPSSPPESFSGGVCRPGKQHQQLGGC